MPGGLSQNVAPAIVPGNGAPVTVSCDVAPVAAHVTTSSALPTPIPELLTFPSSPLALSASGLRSISTSASAAVPGAALRHFCNRLARRGADYMDLKDRFVARKVDIKCLTA